MCRFGEVGEDFFEGERIRRVHEHEGHGGTEEHDLGIRELVELFPLEVSVVKLVLGGVARGEVDKAYSSQNAIACV